MFVKSNLELCNGLKFDKILNFETKRTGNKISLDMDAKDGLESRPDFGRETFQCFNEYYGLLFGVLFHKEFMSFQLI